jgi:hypothetical protein
VFGSGEWGLNPCPLVFQLLLERLEQLGAQIVKEDGPDSSVVLMVFERSAGYYGQPAGKRYPLIDRPPNQCVPLDEIRKLLLHVAYNWDEFWRFPEDLQLRVQVATLESEAPKKNRSVGYLEPRAGGRSDD